MSTVRARTVRATLAPWFLVVGVALAGCGTSGGPGSAAGSGGDVVVGHASDQVDGRTSTIVVPAGQLDLVVGDPVDEVSADLAGDGDSHDAPDGGAFLPVSWTFDALAPIPGRAVVGQQPVTTDVVLSAGGDDVDLPSPYTVQGSAIGSTPAKVFYVPVTDTASPTISATYDGLAQILDVDSGTVDSGVAAALYGADPGSQDVDCSPTGTVAGDSGRLTAEITCDLGVQRVPYRPGSGWAAEGRTWAVVGHDVTVGAVTGPDGGLDVVETTASVQVDGAGALGTVETLGGATSSAVEAQAIEVFDAPATGGEASVTVTVQAQDAGEPIGYDRTLTLP